MIAGNDIKFPPDDKVESGDICFSKAGWKKMGEYRIGNIKKVPK